MKFEIFRTGKHTDSSGTTREFKESDLDSVVSNYDKENDPAPLVIGHPKINDPCYGTVSKVWREGGKLFAEAENVLDDFADMLKKKLFPKRSVKLVSKNGGLALNHIGFLGAHKPAIKGLSDVQFAASDDGQVFEFADHQTAWGFYSLGRLLQGWRDKLIEDKGVEDADKFLPQYEIDNLKNIKADEKEGPMYSAPQEDDMDKVKELETKVTELEGKVSEFSAQVQTEKDRADKAEATIATMENKAKEAEFSAFVDKQIADGKVLPAQKNFILTTMKGLAGDKSELEFGENQKGNALDAYKHDLASQPKVMEYSEFATPEKAPVKVGQASAKLEELTDKKVKESGLEYSAASKEVLKENPALASAYAVEISA